MNPLEVMLMELESNQLTVILVPQKRPTHDGGMIRVAASKNCNWYRKFCAANPSHRVRRNSCPDTKIKRFRAIDALTKMIAGQPSTYHCDELSRIARNWK
jgi:hypothetical protein